MPVDALTTIIFIIIGIGFITNVFKKLKELSGRDTTYGEYNIDIPLPIKKESKEERIQNEINQLRYSTPTPPPKQTWVNPQPVIKEYSKEELFDKKVGKQETETVSDLPSISPYKTVDDPYMIRRSDTETKSYLTTLLEDEDPIDQGIIMSIVLNPPKALQTRSIKRPL